MNYGFIGLGNLGAHLANSLLKAGFGVRVNDLDRTLASSLEERGAIWAETTKDAATNVDAVITCLPSPAVSEQVLKEILPHMGSQTTWIEMSTLGKEEILRLAEIAKQAGVETMELPVTGGVHLAAQGQITMLAGGSEHLYKKHLPALEAMGNQIFHMGPLGSASLIKVITNMLAFIHLVADAEALMLAKRGGLDLGQAWWAIKASSGSSFVHETEGQLILNGSYDVAFTMDLALKDLGFAMEFGREFDVPLDLASLVQKTFEKGREEYGGAAQSPMIAKLLEDVVGTDLRATGFPARLE
ncbi:MAG: NAD(P)-dependent oxidoreductase [Pseudomonadota bacterium]